MHGNISGIWCRLLSSTLLKTTYFPSYFALQFAHQFVTTSQTVELDNSSKSKTLQSTSQLLTNLSLERLNVRDYGTDNNQKGQDDPKTDHLTRTSDNTRDPGVHPVIVHEVNSLSPTVKEVILKSEHRPPKFSFKAGQWVDVFIPNLETVGGFSMSSAPAELIEFSILRLAVKYSTHPPALWMHNQCKVGDKLHIRVGGDFFYVGENKHERPVMLIAGGVGINPLCSIVRCIEDGKRKGIVRKCLPVCLLYSTKTEDELIFKDVFDNYAGVDEHFLPLYYVTRKNNTKPSDNLSEMNLHSRRMAKSDLERAMQFLTQTSEPFSQIDAYVCGPPPMITNITSELRALKVESINFEQWW
ncbi:unnamed protein product [Orchesella dallaii]|uniref:Oxidoreductase NAD-binding domain-containing protein 1 n=1 Tax=Orchesella dallaii TaxID=48710 RepID=A0ABP1QCV5_9HEXA